MAGIYHAGVEAVPGYRLEACLGRGGFGEVWRVSGPGGCKSALKIIVLQGKHAFKELRAVSQVKNIRHPHLVMIQGIWFRDGQGNIIDDSNLFQRQDLKVDSLPMEQRPREMLMLMGLGDMSLFDRLEECKQKGSPGIPALELIGYMEESAKAIDHLNSPRHDLGLGTPMAIQHCDIKPQNIMLVGGSAQVCDFGLAKVLDAKQQIREMTQGAGAATLAYAAPEVLSGKGTSNRTDQYSLGITYYELRTGGFPFPEDAQQYQVIQIHVHGTLDLSGLSPSEAKVIAKATRVNPEERFESCSDMVRALRRAVEGGIEPELDDGPPSSSGLAAAMNIGHGVILSERRLQIGREEVWFAQEGHQELAVIIRELTQGSQDIDLAALRLVRSTLHRNEEGWRDHFLRDFSDYWMLDARGRPVYDDAMMSSLAANQLGVRFVLTGRRASGTLFQRLEECKGQGMELSELLHYTCQAATALDFLNAEREVDRKMVRIMHLNVRPINILFASNQADVRLGNFSQVRLLHGDAAPLPADVVMTHTFLAPELLYNRTLTRWSDQYSLALMYLHLRLGEMPFDPASATTTIIDDLRAGKLRFGSLLPREADVVKRAVDVQYNRRFHSCLEFFNTLVSAVGVEPERPIPKSADASGIMRALPPTRSTSKSGPFMASLAESLVGSGPRRSSQLPDMVGAGVRSSGVLRKRTRRTWIAGLSVMAIIVGSTLAVLSLSGPPRPIAGVDTSKTGPTGAASSSASTGKSGAASTSGGVVAKTATTKPENSSGTASTSASAGTSAAPSTTTSATTASVPTKPEPTKTAAEPPTVSKLHRKFQDWLAISEGFADLAPTQIAPAELKQLKSERPDLWKQFGPQLQKFKATLQAKWEADAGRRAGLVDLVRKEAQALRDFAAEYKKAGLGEEVETLRLDLWKGYRAWLEAQVESAVRPNFDVLGKHLQYAAAEPGASPVLELGLVEAWLENPSEFDLRTETAEQMVAAHAPSAASPWKDYREYVRLRLALSGRAASQLAETVKEVKAAFQLNLPPEAPLAEGGGALEKRLAPFRSELLARRLLDLVRKQRLERSPGGKLLDAVYKPFCSSPSQARDLQDGLQLSQAIAPAAFESTGLYGLWAFAAFECQPPLAAAGDRASRALAYIDAKKETPPPREELQLCRIRAEADPAKLSTALPARARGWELLRSSESLDEPFLSADLVNLDERWLEPALAPFLAKPTADDPVVKKAAASLVYARGWVFLRRQHPAKAPDWAKQVASLGKAVQLDPQPDYLAARAYCRLYERTADKAGAADSLAAAAADLQAARVVKPASAMVLFASGQYWLKKAETLESSDRSAAWKQAEEAFQEAVTSAQTADGPQADLVKAQALARRARCFYTVAVSGGDAALVGRCLKDAEEACRAWPTLAEGWMFQGLALYEQALSDGKSIQVVGPLFDRAESSFSEALKLDPTWAFAHYWRAKSALRHQVLLPESERRQSLIDQAILEIGPTAPDYPDALYWRGQGYFLLKRYAEAEADFAASAAADHPEKLFARWRLTTTRIVRAGAPTLTDLSDLDAVVAGMEGSYRGIAFQDWLRQAMRLGANEAWKPSDSKNILVRLEARWKEFSLQFPEQALEFAVQGELVNFYLARRARLFPAAFVQRVVADRTNLPAAEAEKLTAARAESKRQAEFFEEWAVGRSKLPAEQKRTLQTYRARLWSAVGTAELLGSLTLAAEEQSAAEDRALAAFAKAVELAPEDSESWMWRRDQLNVLRFRFARLAADDPKRPALLQTAKELIAEARKRITTATPKAAATSLDSFEAYFK